jgi:hypothetical protein
VSDNSGIASSLPAYLKERGVPEHPRDLLNHACLLHKFPATGKIEHWP